MDRFACGSRRFSSTNATLVGNVRESGIVLYRDNVGYIGVGVRYAVMHDSIVVQK